jgi:hypothetical protein
VLAGYEHFKYHDALWQELQQPLPEPSLANGYEHCRVHLFECLRNIAQRRLKGVVAEFGMFRGGTTIFLARAAQELGADVEIVGFDTFDGFPPPRHLYDMYDHPDLAQVDLDEVQRATADYPIKIVPGDMVETAKRALDGLDVVLAFIDTDNYTSGCAAIEAVKDRVPVGGAIVFDHYTGRDRFVRTLGERFAAQDLLESDERYFNLHGTGVFFRQSTNC